MTKGIEGFAQGRLTQSLTFEINAAGPQPGEYDPTPRYPDGTPIKKGFSTGSNRGRPKGTGLGIGHSTETKKRIVERYLAGEGLQPLAAAYSTRVIRVREILVQAGVDIRPFGQQKAEQRSEDMPRGLDDQTKETIYQLYGEGKSADDIAAQIGIGKSTVYAYLAKRKKETNPQSDLPKSPDRSRKLTVDQIDEVLSLYEGGKPITEIARQFGVHDSTLHYHLNEYGVKKRKPQNDQLDLSTSKAVATDDSTAKKKRTIPPKRTDVTDEMARRWTIAVKLLGCSVADIAHEEGFSQGLIFGRINSYLRKHPHVIEEEIEAQSNRMGRTNKPSIDEQMDDPEMAAPMVLEVMELETRPRLPYMPPAIVRTGSLKPVTVMPEIQTMRVNTLEQLPRLAELVRDLKSIEGVNVAGSISIALSIEAEL